MKVKEELLNKNGLAIMKLAGELGRFRPGDRLPRVTDLARQINLSVGTTQYGLNFLKEKNIVSLVSRGHLGTYIESMDYDVLQEYAGTSDKACVMPLPYSLRYEGIATAFTELGNGSGKFNVAFMNGSRRRIDALLRSRYDCALLSRMAAEENIAAGMAIEIAVAYGPGSFLENHVLVYRTGNPGKIKTLGLDPGSMDQSILSKRFLEQHPRVKVIDLPYTNIIKRLLAGDVDASLWNLDYIKEHQPGLPYKNLDLPGNYSSMTEAVLVVRTGDAAAADFLSRRFPKKSVLRLQQRVISGQRIPEY